MSPSSAQADPVLQGSRFRSVNVSLTPMLYDSGNVTVRRLPIGNLLKGLILRLNGSISWAAAPTQVGNEQPLELIQKIEIVTDTNRTLWSTSGRDAFRYAHLLYGKQNELVSPNYGGSSPQSFSATIRIPIEAIRFVKPVETYNNTRRYQNMDLRITWGTPANLYTGGTTPVIAATTSIDVIAQMSTTGFGVQRFDKIMSYDEISVTSTQAALLQDIPRNGHLSRILLRTVRNAATVDDLVNNVSLIIDYSGRARDTLNWRTLQQGNVQDYQLDGAAVLGSQIPGYAVLDLIEDQYLSSCLNTYLVNKAQLSFNVTRTSGTELIRITYEFFEPLKEALGDQS